MEFKICLPLWVVELAESYRDSSAFFLYNQCCLCCIFNSLLLKSNAFLFVWSQRLILRPADKFSLQNQCLLYSIRGHSKCRTQLYTELLLNVPLHWVTLWFNSNVALLAATSKHVIPLLIHFGRYPSCVWAFCYIIKTNLTANKSNWPLKFWIHFCCLWHKS